MRKTLVALAATIVLALSAAPAQAGIGVEASGGHDVNGGFCWC